VQITLEQLSYVVAIIAGVGGFLWKIHSRISRMDKNLSREMGEVKTTTSNTRDWVRHLRDGKGPICAEHATRLDGVERELLRHDETLQDHGERITRIEHDHQVERRAPT
jgi:hypothetical protein